MFDYGIQAAEAPDHSGVYVEECDFDATGIEVPEPPGLLSQRAEPDAGEWLERDDDPIERKSVRDMTKRELGLHGETIAARFLYDHWGWTILARNWVNHFGEVDIVALEEEGDADTVVLVEVKTRLALKGEEDVFPEFAVGPNKIKRYQLMAMNFMCAHPETKNLRFDVVALSVTGENTAHMRHIFNAVEWDVAL